MLLVYIGILILLLSCSTYVLTLSYKEYKTINPVPVTVETVQVKDEPVIRDHSNSEGLYNLQNILNANNAAIEKAYDMKSYAESKEVS